MIAYEKPERFPGTEVYHSDPTGFSPARSFCSLTCILTSPFASESYEIHIDQEHRDTEMGMVREMGRPGEQSCKRDHMPLLANLILENSQPLNAMITLSYC